MATKTYPKKLKSGCKNKNVIFKTYINVIKKMFFVFSILFFFILPINKMLFIFIIYFFILPIYKMFFGDSCDHCIIKKYITRYHWLCIFSAMSLSSYSHNSSKILFYCLYLHFSF